MGCGACINGLHLWRHRVSSRRRKAERPGLILSSVKEMVSVTHVCATGAIQLKHFTDEEILSEIDAAFPEEEVIQPMDAAVGDR